MHSALSEAAVRKAALYVGVAALIVGMGMAFEYGRAMSMLHAISLGLLAIAVSIAFIGAEIYRAGGRHTAAIIATIAGVGFSLGEYGTHFGYTVGTRASETQQTGVQNTKYAEAQKNRDREVANLDMWREHLAKLQADNAWVATVSADGLRAQVAAADLAIEQETARGGCGPKCLKLTKDKGDLENRIALAEQASDLSKKIEATQRILDKKVEVADTTEFHSSKIVNQTAGFAQIATWSDEPSESALSWTQLVLGAIIAAITTYLAPFCLSIAYGGIRGAKPEDGKPALNVEGLSAIDATLGGVSSVSLREHAALPALQPLGDIHLHEGKDPRFDALMRAIAAAGEKIKAPDSMSLRDKARALGVLNAA
jgi:hypothetical protein